MPRQKLPTTGTSPHQHNVHRLGIRKLDRITRAAFRITDSRGRIPRKRKKFMYKVERANYRALLFEVAASLAARDQKQATG